MNGALGMTNPAPENQKEHDWVEDHQHPHHRGEVINAAAPSSSELPASSAVTLSSWLGQRHRSAPLPSRTPRDRRPLRHAGRNEAGIIGAVDLARLLPFPAPA
jgi:hypothetical protein